MRKISSLLMMALLAIGMGLTSCDEQLDNAVVPGVTPGTDEGEVTSITVDLSKIDEKYLDTEKTKLQLTVGDEVTLSFTILPEEMASTEVELTAADATILSIDGLKVKALKEGETKVTAKAGDKTAECTVTVKAATVAVTSVTLDKAVQRIDRYTNATLTATVSPADATDKTVTWKSSDETVATVDASGKITPKKAGTVTIKATAGDKTATSTVYVYDMIYNSNSYGSIEVPAGNSYLLTGNGNTSNTEIKILDGATVTLNGINVSKQIECKGTATIILADGSTNTVTAPNNKAAIKAGGSGTTLTITGTGSLTANGGNYAAGIGGEQNCGRIIISGGNITATGRVSAGIGSGKDASCDGITISGGTVVATCSSDGGAGIGSGRDGSCGDITISGGTITATGASGAAGIGTGLAYSAASCGDITITADVTSVTATKGGSAPNSIGAGGGMGTNTCGTVTIGGVVGAISTSPYTYQP